MNTRAEALRSAPGERVSGWDHHPQHHHHRSPNQQPRTSPRWSPRRERLLSPTSTRLSSPGKSPFVSLKPPPRREEIMVKSGEYPESENPLLTSWTFWFEQKGGHHQHDSGKYPPSPSPSAAEYSSHLNALGTFNTVEGFYKHFAFMPRVGEAGQGKNLFMFRKGARPMWEQFPNGGCWLLRLEKNAGVVDFLWESLVLGCIREAFDVKEIVGCAFSSRKREDVLAVWNDETPTEEARLRIAEKWRQICQLDVSTTLQYKENNASMKDNSTYKNARTFMFTPMMSPNLCPPPPPDMSLSGGGDELGLLPPAVHTEHGDYSLEASNGEISMSVTVIPSTSHQPALDTRSSPPKSTSSPHTANGDRANGGGGWITQKQKNHRPSNRFGKSPPTSPSYPHHPHYTPNSPNGGPRRHSGSWTRPPPSQHEDTQQDDKHTETTEKKSLPRGEGKVPPASIDGTTDDGWTVVTKSKKKGATASN